MGNIFQSLYYFAILNCIVDGKKFVNENFMVLTRSQKRGKPHWNEFVSEIKITG